MNKFVAIFISIFVAYVFSAEYTVDESSCLLYNNFYEITQEEAIAINVETDVQVTSAYLPDFTDYSCAILLSPDFSIEFGAAVEKFEEWRKKAINMGNVALNKTITNITVRGAVENEYTGEWSAKMVNLECKFITLGGNYLFGLCYGDNECTFDNTILFTNKQISIFNSKIKPEALMGLIDKASQQSNIEDQFN